MASQHYFIKPKTRDITSTTFTTSGPDIDALTDGEYPQYTADLNRALHSLGYARINIYTDASGTVFALDNNSNPISSRLITQTAYTYPYVDASANIIDGSFTVTFDDGSYYYNVNANDRAYWYSIEQTGPSTIYQFT
jgi:hypothetical protein